MRFAAGDVLAMLPAAVVLISAPHAARAQIASARPASVSLTIVVPPRAESVAPLAAVRPLGVVRRGESAIDAETSVDIGNHRATRVEVALGEWPADSVRVWVRNSRGDLERLTGQGRVVAVDRPVGTAVTLALVRFHVDSDRPLHDATFGVPLEYRVRVGSADVAATWTFASILRLDAAP